MSNNIWVFVQQDEGKIADVSLQLISKATDLAKDYNAKSGNSAKVEAILLGEKVKDLAEEVIRYGAEKVFCIEDSRLKYYTPLPYTKVLIDLIKKNEPQIILYGATTTGRDVGPRVASALKVGLTADCTELEIGNYESRGESYENILYQIRPAFGGNIVATIVSPEKKPQMATVREGVMKLNAPDSNRKGEIVEIASVVEDSDCLSEIIERVKKEKSVNLTASQIIVAGGMGVGTKEGFDIIADFAKTIGADVAASRAAVDAGFINKDHQVGQTGVTVRPKLYIACGISGAIQHRAGMDESAKIIAVNSDPDAPIFQIAHYGIVGEISDVIPKLQKAFQAKA
jgi:electron transfer flavoprotein alpha subunit